MELSEKCFRELSLDEAKSINGGGLDRNTNFFYDIAYSVSHIMADACQAINRSEVLTYEFWEDWGYSVL